MPSIDLTYLNGPDVAALALTDDEILTAVEGGLKALAYSCDRCGFIRWHRMDRTEQPS